MRLVCRLTLVAALAVLGAAGTAAAAGSGGVGGAGLVGASELLHVMELDDGGLMHDIVNFDPDDIDAAIFRWPRLAQNRCQR